MFEFRLPDIGEGVMEGEIVQWHVSPGDRVREDDPMVEVMTDKATVTIGAPRPGVIRELRFSVGAVAAVGDVLVVIDTDGSVRVDASKPPSVRSPASDAGEEPVASAVGDLRDGLPGASFFSSKRQAEPMVSERAGEDAGSTEYFNEKPLATPATRKLARDLSVDLRCVRPSGAGGRVRKEDVQTFARGQAREAASESVVHPEPESVSATNTVVSLAAPTVAQDAPAALEVRKPLVGVRRVIAERMQRSKNTAAHFTFVEECHADALIELRERLAPRAADRGVKLTFLPFITKAVVSALRKHPILNSMLDEESQELVFRKYHHVGIAVATEQGLVVPVVRDADRLSLIELAVEIERLASGAREGSLSRHEMVGSTFTITSLGRLGGLMATPVLNYPEVGILGVHQIKERPVVRNGDIVVGNVMLLSLSFDHRIVDGHVGAAFAYDVIRYLEEPDELFLTT